MEDVDVPVSSSFSTSFQTLIDSSLRRLMLPSFATFSEKAREVVSLRSV